MSEQAFDWQKVMQAESAPAEAPPAVTEPLVVEEGGLPPKLSESGFAPVPQSIREAERHLTQEHAGAVQALLAKAGIGPEAVALLSRGLARFARAGIPVILTSGNHDSAIRLGFGAELTETAGIHLRTSVTAVADPVVLHDVHGPVGVYGLPYLVPDAVRDYLGADRSHESVLRAATSRLLADSRERGLERVVVMAHAFVTGSESAAVSESERDLRVGGIADSPASALDGPAYVALGHLHRPQDVRLTGSSTVVRYSGSPLPLKNALFSSSRLMALLRALRTPTFISGLLGYTYWPGFLVSTYTPWNRIQARWAGRVPRAMAMPLFSACSCRSCGSVVICTSPVSWAASRVLGSFMMRNSSSLKSGVTFQCLKGTSSITMRWPCAHSFHW